MPGMPPGAPFDMSKIKEMLEDPSIKEMAKQISEDPSFKAMAENMQQAMAASMASLQQGHSRRPQAGAPVPMTASCEEEQLQQGQESLQVPPP